MKRCAHAIPEKKSGKKEDNIRELHAGDSRDRELRARIYRNSTSLFLY
ncbi:MAG: hypothetical protein K2X86_15795 [Cytophagaceae bacterium]|nr:hypothetical protein [Cytophagaceae bacterium]